MFHAFICHASEDKDKVARPLAQALIKAGLKIWYDEFSLKLGDSLRQAIEKGLAESKFGIVILSPSFFAKKWPQAELNGLFAKEIHGTKVVLPVWHDVKHGEIVRQAPILADKKAARTSQGMDKVVAEILDVIEPEISHTTSKGVTVSITPVSIRLHTGEWGVKNAVRISNQSDSGVYSVYVKLAVESGDIKSEAIEVKPDAPSTTLESIVLDIAMSEDLITYDVIDAQGHEALILRFHTIEARKSREVIFSGESPRPSSARFSVLSFKDSPEEVLEKTGQASRPVVFPEPVKLKAIRAKLRRLT